MPNAPPVYRPPGSRTVQERRRELGQHRRKTVERGYDAAWKRARMEYLTFHVLCECDLHQGKDLTALAEVVDHIVPIAQNPDLRLEYSNMRAMSKRCHDAHTARTVGFGRRPPTGRGYAR